MVIRDNTANFDKLNNVKIVKQLVPKDTTFAVIADLTGKDFSGAACLCVGSGQLSIITVGETLTKANLASVSVKLSRGKYTIHLPGHTYTIISLSPIAGAGDRFVSRVAGIDGGVSPLLNALSGGGASVSGISGAKYYIAIVVFAAVLVIVVGAMFYIGIK